MSLCVWYKLGPAKAAKIFVQAGSNVDDLTNAIAAQWGCRLPATGPELEVNVSGADLASAEALDSRVRVKDIYQDGDTLIVVAPPPPPPLPEEAVVASGRQHLQLLQRQHEEKLQGQVQQQEASPASGPTAGRGASPAGGPTAVCAAGPAAGPSACQTAVCRRSPTAGPAGGPTAPSVLSSTA